VSTRSSFELKSEWSRIRRRVLGHGRASLANTDMPRKRIQKTKVAESNAAAQKSVLPSIPAAEALSFLRDTRGMSTWTARDMAKSFDISVADANRIIPVLELQGYVKPAGTGEWMTTLSGEGVSGSKLPRYTRERIDEALSSLRDRIAEINRDSNAPYKITQAVAFGDFLGDTPRLQSAEVGVQLERRGGHGGDANSAKERRAQSEFLKQLHGKGGVVHIVPFESWMRERTHRNLL
jgi:hypothetical protein